MKEFSGKVAVVTGAASGIGQTSAQLYARESAWVAVSDIGDAGAQETVRLMEDAGSEAFFY